MDAKQKAQFKAEYLHYSSEVARLLKTYGECMIETIEKEDYQHDDFKLIARYSIVFKLEAITEKLKSEVWIDAQIKDILNPKD